MHFGENELSPSSIGFSPLNLSHLPTFQRRWVRSSTASYCSFNLDRPRSLGFASITCDLRPLKTRFPFGSTLLTSPHIITRRMINQNPRSQLAPPTVCKHMVSNSFSLPYSGFFSPFPHGTLLYRLVKVFSLMWYGPHWFTPNSSCLMLLGINIIYILLYTIRGYHSLWPGFPTLFRLHNTYILIMAISINISLYHMMATSPSLTPPCFRLFPLRSPLLRESFLLSFPLAT